MKRYKIQKVVMANNLAELLALESCDEIVTVDLLDEVNNWSDIGFVKTHERQGNDMVQKVRKGSRSTKSSS